MTWSENWYPIALIVLNVKIITVSANSYDGSSKKRKLTKECARIRIDLKMNEKPRKEREWKNQRQMKETMKMLLKKISSKINM